jgi:phosphatidylserine/phosphatidylglycerophosphate/cardiolipin synthase-like enzyme
MKRIVVSILSALALLSTASVAVAAPAPPYSPRNSVAFNLPNGTRAQQYAIVTQIERSIDGSQKGSTIRIAHYSFDIPSTLNKLIAAHRRGVNVQMVIDRHEVTAETKKLTTELGRNKTKLSFVATCKRSCMSSKPSVMHAKFYLFSAVGTSKLVSMISSANLSNTNAATSWNNNQTIVGDAKIYASLNKYFVDMLADRDTPRYFRTTSSGKYKLYLYPRAAAPNYLAILDVLRHVKCKGTAKGYGSGGRTVVRVAMYSWSYPRRDIANRLWTLHNNGCKVDVIYNSARTNRNVTKALLKRSTKYGTMKVYDAWKDKNHNGLPERYMHHKALIVNGIWFAKNNVKVTYTGSQNFTANATLDNNDIIFRIIDNATYNAYSKNLSYIESHSTKRVTSVPRATSAVARQAAKMSTVEYE